MILFSINYNIQNMENFMKKQNQTYQAQFQKFKIKNDYSFVQEKLIQNMESILEKQYKNQSFLKEKIDNLEENYLRLQQQKNSMSHHKFQDIKDMGINYIKRRITKYTPQIEIVKFICSLSGNLFKLTISQTPTVSILTTRLCQSINKKFRVFSRKSKF